MNTQMSYITLLEIHSIFTILNPVLPRYEQIQLESSILSLLDYDQLLFYIHMFPSSWLNPQEYYVVITNYHHKITGSH